LEDKIKLIGNRTDISHVFDRVDIYLNTFPIMGALMSQYAILFNKPLIGYSPSNIPCNEAESLFFGEQFQFTFSCKNEFHHQMDKLISDVENGKNIVYPTLLHTETTFNRAFLELMESGHSVDSNGKINFDAEKFSSLYFEMENQSLKNYELLILQTLRFKLLKDIPILFLSKCFRYLFRKKLDF